MSIRTSLAAHRHAIQELDEPLRSIEEEIGTDAARTQVARARAMLRAADQLIGGALRLPLTGDGAAA